MAKLGTVPGAQKAVLSGLALLLALVQVRQPFPAVAPLHHIPTLVVLAGSPFLLRRWPMSTASVGCVVAFFALHTIGGRYTYTNVPYDTWALKVVGVSISEALGLTRSHYDRLVHFSYGLLAVQPTREFLQRHLGVSRRLALYIAVESVIAASAVYELIEWWLSIILAGPMAADYNGQQGDIWDAQKDMALAACGAMVAATWLRIRSRHLQKAA